MSVQNVMTVHPIFVVVYQSISLPTLSSLQLYRKCVENKWPGNMLSIAKFCHLKAHFLSLIDACLIQAQ